MEITEHHLKILRAVAEMESMTSRALGLLFDTDEHVIDEFLAELVEAGYLRRFDSFTTTESGAEKALEPTENPDADRDLSSPGVGEDCRSE